MNLTPAAPRQKTSVRVGNSAVIDAISKDINDFLESGVACCDIAVETGKDVGRIASQILTACRKMGYYYYETVDGVDYEVQQYVHTVSSAKEVWLQLRRLDAPIRKKVVKRVAKEVADA